MYAAAHQQVLWDCYYCVCEITQQQETGIALAISVVCLSLLCYSLCIPFAGDGGMLSVTIDKVICKMLEILCCGCTCAHRSKIDRNSCEVLDVSAIL